MTITATRLTQAAGVCATVAGAIFIGVNINHPHVDVASITTTELVVRNSLKVLMCALVRRNRVLGLIGYLVLATGYLLIMSTTFVTAYVLPSIAKTDPTYVKDVIAVATGGTATGAIGALGTINKVQGFAYLAGGLLFGIALYRAHVLARWAAVLLAVGGVVSAALSVMPDAFYRLLAYPNGIAMIGLGYSLWSTARRDVSMQPAEVGDRRATATGGDATA